MKSCLENWEWVKEYVRAELINTERNKELLSQYPHKVICDLRIVFYLVIETPEGICAKIGINYRLMEMYGQSIESLYEQAMNNIQKDEIFFMKMAETEDSRNDEIAEKIEMYICSNKNLMYGASVILAPLVKELFRKNINREVYVLLLSVHESIIIPKKPFIKPNDLCDMAKDVNGKFFSAEEYLSENVYSLDTNGNLKIVV